MSRLTWSMHVSTDNGQNWTADGTIYRPNESVTIPLLSTQVKLRTADGDNVFVTPETKYSDEPITFRWLEIANSDSFYLKIKNYVKNQNYLRITDHLSNTYIGRFISFNPIWLSGVEDTYDCEAVFEIMA